MPIEVVIQRSPVEVVVTDRETDPVIIRDPDGVAEAHVHPQTTPAASWHIAPPVGMFSRKPDVQILVENEVVLTDISITGPPYAVLVTFAEPTAGEAILS